MWYTKSQNKQTKQTVTQQRLDILLQQLPPLLQMRINELSANPKEIEKTQYLRQIQTLLNKIK